MKKSTILVFLLVAALLTGGLYFRYHGKETDARGATRLMRSIESNAELKDTTKLIEKSNDVNVRDKSGQTALFYAARHAQDPQVIRDLLTAGANLHIADNMGQTCLMTAAQYNPNVEVLEEFTKNGAHVNAADAAGNTALLLAAQYNTAPVIKSLLRAKADPDAAGPDGLTAAEALAANQKLSEQEKTDYRQAMLVLSILHPMR